MITKVCSKCGIEKDLDEFHKSKRNKDGLKRWCKDCRNEYNRNKKYYKSYYENNKEKIRKYRRKYYILDREKDLERSKIYKKNNRNKINEYVRNYRKYSIDKKLHEYMSVGIYRSLKGKKNTLSWTDFVDYSLEDLKNHIENRFENGMNWNNYGDWHIDHIVPKSLFNIKCSNDYSFKLCWSLNNLQPLWKYENISKNNKINYYSYEKYEKLNVLHILQHVKLNSL